MRFLLAGLACSIALLGCRAADQPAAAQRPPASAATASGIAGAGRVAVADAMARYDGYGEMRFGMDEVSFSKAWRGELRVASGRDTGCHFKTPTWAKRTADFAFMFEQGRFVRYDVGTDKELAPGGGAVGMSAQRIRQMYGAHVDVQPHKYVEGGKYLRIAAEGTSPPLGKGMLVFETDAQGKVTRWHVGRPPQVDYVEGCG